MKTIETLSQEYSQKVGLDENEEFIYLQGLKAGVEFAQQWVPVNENELEVEVNILIKTNLEEVCVAYYLDGEFHTVDMDDIIELDEVVGYRQINLK